MTAAPLSLDHRVSLMHSNLSPVVTEFLNTHFAKAQDTANAERLLLKLESDQNDLAKQREELQVWLAEKTVRAASKTEGVLQALSTVAEHIERAQDKAASATANMQPMVGELAALAAEVARVERVRLYVERLLELEHLVGNFEDTMAEAVAFMQPLGAVSPQASAASEASSKKLEVLAAAVSAFSSAVGAVAAIAHSKPHWKKLRLSADVRIDRAAAALRPLLLQSYRDSLHALGWPPGLGGKVSANALAGASGQKRRQFEDSFVALTALQGAERLRLTALKQQAGGAGGGGGGSMEPGVQSQEAGQAVLWSFQELVTPLAAKAEPHFARWVDTPEWVFALVVRVTKAHVTTIDAALQPLLERAGLAGASAREEWVRAMARLPAVHLRSKALPEYVRQVEGEPSYSGRGAAMWLHTVDQALAFDAQMRGLAVGAWAGSLRNDLGFSLEAVASSVEPALDVLAERGDWLQLWASIEVEESLHKVRAALDSDGAWGLAPAFAAGDALAAALAAGGNAVDLPVSGTEFRPPACAEAVLGITRLAFERCRTLTRGEHRLAFVQAVGGPLAATLVDALLKRAREVEALTALADVSAMVKVCGCANAAHYAAHTLQEWGEELFFVDLQDCRDRQPQEGDGWELLDDDGDDAVAGPAATEGMLAAGAAGGGRTFFDAEVAECKSFYRAWVAKVVAAVVRGFDARSTEYVRNKRRWQDLALSDLRALDFRAAEPASSVDAGGLHALQQPQQQPGGGDSSAGLELSPALVETVVTLGEQLTVLEGALDARLFLDLWRAVAGKLDEHLMSAVVGAVDFSNAGAQQFAADVRALFSVFGRFCERPSSFFKGLREALLLLQLEEGKALALLHSLSDTETWQASDGSDTRAGSRILEAHSIASLPPAVVERILRRRQL
eukprot:jgi/Mesen1/4383/ME000222S03501